MSTVRAAEISTAPWTANLERLKSQGGRRRGAMLIQVVLRAATAVYGCALAAALRLPRRRMPERADVLVTGSFASANWSLSHLAPIAGSSRCARVAIVTTKPMPLVPNLVAVHPPRWAVRALGETAARMLTFVAVAIRRRPDVVGGFHLLANGLAAALLARLIGARSLYFCGGGPTEVLGGGAFGENRLFSRLPSADRVIERRLLAATRSFDVMVTMGNRAADFFAELTGRRPHVIPAGIDADRFEPAALQPPDLILVGRLVPVKQVGVFLSVVHRLKREFPGIRARIVGNGPLRGELEELCGELGLGESVTFVGHREDVQTELRRSGIFVLTSASEGVSLALLEAMMCGLPAVVPDIGDLRDLVHDGIDGCLVATPTVDAFVERLRALLRAPDERRRLGAAARRTALAHEVNAVAARWDAILAALDPSGRQEPPCEP